MTDRSTKNDPRFVEYYARESLTDKTAERARGIMRAVLQARARTGDALENLLVADIGCNTGMQSRCWLEHGHRVRGIDIGADLVALARTRNIEFGVNAQFEVASATRLPWESGLFDVALLPELLEHVDDWEAVLNEAIRVLKPGGSLFLSTTNVLCPVQQEFALPLYSWYPGWLKKHYLKRSLTDAPRLANYATFPAVHWFSPYTLKRYLAERGVVASDRFDLIDATQHGVAAKTILGAIRLLPPLRFAAHVATPSTLMYGRKQGSNGAPAR